MASPRHEDLKKRLERCRSLLEDYEEIKKEKKGNSSEVLKKKLEGCPSLFEGLTKSEKPKKERKI